MSLESNITFKFQNFKRNKSVSMNELFNGHGLTSTLYEVEEFVTKFGQMINSIFPKEETQMNWSCSCDYASKDVVKASFDQNQFEWSQDWGFDEEPIITPEWYREIDVAGVPTVILFTIKPTEYDELDTRCYEFALKTIGLTAEELELVTSSFAETFNSVYKLSEMEVYSSTEIILGSFINQ